VKPEVIDQVARSLRSIRPRITSQEHQHLSAEVQTLRQLKASITTQYQSLLDTSVDAGARTALARRWASFYQRLGRLQQTLDRYSRRVTEMPLTELPHKDGSD